MAFKHASERQNFNGRTGSDATKPRATGRVDAVPRSAVPIALNLLVEQYQTMQRQQQEMVDEINHIRAQLKSRTIDRTTVIDLEARMADCKRLYGVLRTNCEQFKSLAKASGASSWATAFYYVCEQLLDPQVFIQLVAETDAITKSKAPVARPHNPTNDIKQEAKL